MTMLNLILQQMNNPQHMMDGWASGTGMFAMGLFWILIFVLLATLIWFLVKKGSQSSKQPSDKTPLEILKKRYALGEIDEEQYRRMKKEIDQ